MRLIELAGDILREVTVDGEKFPEGASLRWTDREGFPFPAVYFGDEAQFEVEIWVRGTILHRVPPESEETRRVVALIEQAASELRPARPPIFDPTRYPSLDELQQEISSHPGHVAHLEWEGVARTLTVHQLNAEELTFMLGALATSEELSVEMFQNTRPDTPRRLIRAQLDQKLHNYVASALSLVDHSRRLFDMYPGSSLREAYEDRRSTLSEAPVALFIKQLRNYALHRTLPFLGHTVNLGAPVMTEIQLSTQELMKWGKWSPTSRKYLTQAGESLKLREVVDEHMKLIDDLYGWVFEQFPVWHRAEIVSCDHVVDEFNWVLSGGRQGQPRR